MEEKLRNFLERLLAFLTKEKGKIEIQKEGDDLKISLQLHQAAQLIGRRGENIYYLRHLIWLFLRQQSDFQGKLHLDINQYLYEKEEKMGKWVKQEIEKVVMTNQPASFYNLSPYERRFVHLICAADERVTSSSSDTPRGRVLTIAPSGNEEK